ncbi:MAG: CHAT domain-containing protein [Microcoleaceae cyanobacterium]
MRKRRWQAGVFGLLFFLTIILINPLNNIINSRAIAVEISQSQQNTVEQAKAFYFKQNYQKAIELWQQAIDEFAAKNQPLNQAMALSNLSLSYQKLGQWQQAETAIIDSLNLLEFDTASASQNQIRLLAQVLNIQGNFYLETGQPKIALETWKKATEYYTQIQDNQGIIKSQINQAQALQILGFYPKACQILTQALQLNYSTCEWSPELQTDIQTLPANSVNILALRQLGKIFRLLGDISGATQVLLTALNQTKQLNEIEQMAAIYISLGQATLEQEIALTYYQKAVNIAVSPLLKTQAKIEVLNLLLQQQDWQKFNQLLSEINLDNLPLNQSGINTEIYLAEILIRLLSNSTNHSIDNIELEAKIQNSLTEIIEKAKQINFAAGISYGLGLTGKLYEINQEFKQAENLTLQALNTIEKYREKPEISYQFLGQLGRIRREMGETEKAIESYTQAVRLLKSIRQDIIATDIENRFNFQENIEPIYRQLIDLHLKQGKPTNLRTTINLFKSLQIKELNNFFRFACIEEMETQIEQADPTAAIFYTIILQDRLEVIAALPGQPLRHYATAVSADKVQQINLEIRRNIGKLFREKDILPQTKQLYQWLIQPIETELKNHSIKTLVFALDGSLRTLPMALMSDGNQYLVENYNIALALPGLSVRNPNPITSKSIKLLVAGLSEARQNFPPLPGVEAEVNTISQQFPATKVLLNDEFTIANLQKQIRKRNASIIHLATHGQFSSNREQTFILTANEKININNFEMLLTSRYNYGITPIEMLVLSACQTASGDNRAALGLAGVAVRSGARSTLATLWSVSDQSTAEFMESFYQKLTQPNMSRAEALRLAQIDMLKSRNRRPFFWAPFILVGNWF